VLTLPAIPDDFKNQVDTFRTKLRELKQTLATPQPGWYPFDSFTGVEIGLELLRPLYSEFARDVNNKPVADIGCGDGDLALLFAHWGAAVAAIDNPPTNYNQMQAVGRLSQAMQATVTQHRLNLDSRFDFPGHYGFAMLLGALYHLQNPYYVLERLAFHADWCLLSTRVAQRTTTTGIRIQEEPLAYLASGMEINNDSTNYWIFSLTGLLRIVQRTRWAVRGVHHAGCLNDSDPSSPNADERVFLLLQSRVSFPGLQVHTGIGWHDAEDQTFRWTAKRFTLEVVLPLERQFSGFQLALYIPAAVLPDLQVSADINGEPCGTRGYGEEGAAVFRGTFPPVALHHPILTIGFTVQSAFKGDGRDLGICVPLEAGKPSLRVF
jgi:tRNA (mo5U34)-methyltransferase